MIKLMEWIGAMIAILCLMEILSNPRKVLDEIRKGHAPNLTKFNQKLHRE